MKRYVAFCAAIVLALSAGTALATPGSGFISVDLARGTSAAAYTITAAANMDVATQTNTFDPAGSTSGWHSHPGPVLSIVKSGTLSLWFSSDCTLRTLTAGQAIVVPGGAGLFDLARNEDATVPLVIVQTFYNVPVGGPLRTNAPAQCSTAVPSVPQDIAVAGVTGVLHARVRVASAINITGAANTDLYIQQLTGAPGATTGWHSHVGQHTVLVNDGTLTYIRADCSTSVNPSGIGFVTAAGLVHLARNDGTAPTTNFITYTNLPVGTAARVDAAAPTCAAPAASTVPNTAMPTKPGPTPPMPVVPVLFVLGVAGLLALGRSRARHRS